MSALCYVNSMNDQIENKFLGLGLMDPLIRALEDTGYKIPTPIQQKAIPVLLEGKDLLGCAQTGTGKTAAFALPILQNLSVWKKNVVARSPRVLVLAPTRELAIQIEENFRAYSKYLPIRSAVIFGGVNQHHQVKAIERGLDVLIATPGRLLDLVQQRFLNLNLIEIFVLDEADRMLDMGFIHDIKKLLKILPAKRQNLFFSATMPREIEILSREILNDPVKIEIAPPATTAEKVEQKVLYVDRTQKKDVLKYLLEDKTLSKVIIFTRTKHGANRVAEVLDKSRIKSAAIHGNKSQNARQRALEQFKAGEIRALVATDIAARGIDVDDVSHVINFEIPNLPETYVHRIGRTARAGATGKAISLADQDEKSFIRLIEKITGQSIPVDREHPYHSAAVEGAPTISAGKAKERIEEDGRQARGGRPPSRGRPQNRSASSGRGGPGRRFGSSNGKSSGSSGGKPKSSSRSSSQR